MDLSAGAIGGISAAIVVPIVLRVLVKTKTYQCLQRPTQKLEVLAAKYKKWENISKFLLIVFMTIVGYACWLLMCYLEDVRAELLGNNDFVLTPIRAFYGLPSILFGIFLSAIPIKFILLKTLGKDDYREYLQYQDMKSGINSALVFRHMAFVIVPVLLIGVALSYQCYAVVNRDRFVLHPYFDIREHSYKWNEITEIKRVNAFSAPNGNIVRNRPYFIIGMADGNTLNFHDSLLEIPFAEQEKLASFISTQSDRTIIVGGDL